MAKKYLQSGWGGIVLCAKTEEAKLWGDYCQDNGRENDLIIFRNKAVFETGDRKGQKMVFNPIDYEMKREGDGAGETFNITNIFMNVFRLGNRVAGEADAKEERYWDTALKRCLNRIIELIKLSGEDLSYMNMVKALTSSLGVDEEIYREELEFVKEHQDFSRLEKQDNFCLLCLIKANYCNFYEGAEYSQEMFDAYDLVYNYFLIEMPAADDKTRAIVKESFMGIAEPFLSGLLARHFSGVTNLRPELTYLENKIIVLDFPVKEYLDAGIIGQSIFKLLFQQCIERRDVRKFPNPVFLWADEAQYFVNPYDQVFLTTARSSRTATVFLSQSISNYYAVLGGQDSRPKVDSLMGNLSTKIFHANSDAVTNKYASELIGNAITHMSNRSNSKSAFNLNFSNSESIAEHFHPQVQPREFTILRSGGVNYDYNVDSIVFITGKLWSSGTNFLKTSFKQSFSKPIA